jgi:Ca2+/Na+ antiporter
MTERLLIMLAGMLLMLAAFFVWRNNFSGAFVTAALGACVWFLSYRSEMKKTIGDDESDSDNGSETNHEE